MNCISLRTLAKLTLPLALTLAAGAQAPQQAGTFAISGLSGQATVVRIRGKSYVDLDSLAQMMHGTLRTQGGQTILVMPQAASTTVSTPPPPVKPPQLSVGYLAAEIEALTAIREWHVALVNAVQSNAPVAEDWTGRLRRGADTKVQLAVAASSTESDRKALDLLRNQFTNMQQINDHFVGMHAKVDYTSPDSFDNNALDKKIQSCEQGLTAMAATKQFQDEPYCH